MIPHTPLRYNPHTFEYITRNGLCAMFDLDYTRSYIRQALDTAALSPPDEAKAGENHLVLTSLYEAHKRGGKAEAQKAWQTFIQLKPKIAVLIEQPSVYIHVSELWQLPKVEYLLDELPIYAHGINMLVGDRGTGKSMLAVRLACTVAQQHTVTYIAAEGAYTYHGRSLAWHAHHQKNERDTNLYFYNQPVNFMLASEVLEFVRVLTTRETPRLLIVDTVARCMGGFDENSTKDMSTFVASIDSLRRQLGCAVLLIHHTSKTGKSRGSTALEGAVDSVMFLERTDRGIAVYNDYEHGGKNKGAPERPPAHYQIISKEVEEYTGDNAAAVMVEADQVVQDLNRIGELSINQIDILGVLEANPDGLSVIDIEAASGVKKRTIYHNLKPLKQANFVVSRDGLQIITETGIQALHLN